MKLILGLDLETDGLDVKTCHVLEVGAVLWDYESGAALEIYNALVRNDNLTIPPAITALTGIKQEYIDYVGRTPEQVAAESQTIAVGAQAIVAHNGLAFDRPVFQRFLAAYSPADSPGEAVKLPWIDTRLDIPYPPEMAGSRKLKHLAAEHGFLHDNGAHRAVFDVISTLRILQAYDVEKLVKVVASPLALLKANVNYDNRQLASNRGYQWDPDARGWFKQVHELTIPEEKNSDFNFFVLDPGLWPAKYRTGG